MEALSVENLTKYFGGVRVLEDLTFQVPQGERLGVIGPNGAGKTTLINLINGQLEPTRGKIFFFGQDITSLPTHARAHIGQARSYQLCSLFQNLTLWQNTLLTLHGLGKSRYGLFRSAARYRDVNEAAHKVLAEAGLWDRRDDPVSSLAYGDQRRLEIQFCLASDPKVLLLDEPSNGLTKGQAAELVRTINDHIGRDVTVLIVAHDMELIFQVADRLMVLYDGTIIACDTCDVVQCDPRVREIYMGN
jgi:branched-chain amino acid transport system ATP-binding protein